MFKSIWQRRYEAVMEVLENDIERHEILCNAHGEESDLYKIRNAQKDVLELTLSKMHKIARLS